MQNPVDSDTGTKTSQPVVDDFEAPTIPDTNQTNGSYMRSTSLIASFGYAFEGALYAFRTQRNIKVHCVVTLAVIVVGLLLEISLDQWAILAVLVGLVFQTELTNTAVEAIVDRISPEFHTLAKVAKDCSAAAVLVTAFAAVIAGVLIFGPRLIHLLHLGG